MSDATPDDLERAHRIGRPVGRFMDRWRRLIRRYPWLNAVYKVLVTVIGIAIVVLGLVLVPLPGPGWLIVFVGMTVLGSEYHWARRLTGWLRRVLARFWEWWRLRRAERQRRRAEQQSAAEGR